MKPSRLPLTHLVQLRTKSPHTVQCNLLQVVTLTSINGYTLIFWANKFIGLIIKKVEVCVVNLLSAIFGDQRMKGFRGKGK